MIALGCDQAGFELMQEIKTYLTGKGYDFKDFGTYSKDAVDYPIYGKKVAHAVASGECEKGILVCGTGIGISIAANKVKGVRAAAPALQLSSLTFSSIHLFQMQNVISDVSACSKKNKPNFSRLLQFQPTAYIRRIFRCKYL